MWGHLRTVCSARMSNSVQLAFYLFFMLYLIFTSLQMRHRWSARTACAFWGWSRPGRGTMSMWLLAALGSPTAWISSPVLHLRRRSGFSFQAQPAVEPPLFLNHQPASGPKVYLAIPFVEEMRVLTDWTITRSPETVSSVNRRRKRIHCVWQLFMTLQRWTRCESMVELFNVRDSCCSSLLEETLEALKSKDINGFLHVDEVGGRPVQRQHITEFHLSSSIPSARILSRVFTGHSVAAWGWSMWRSLGRISLPPSARLYVNLPEGNLYNSFLPWSGHTFFFPC